MVRIVAMVSGWIGLGVILVEAANHLEIPGVRLPIVYALLPVLVYAFFETLLSVTRSSTVAGQGTRHRKINGVYQWILGMVGLIFFLSIPFLWWETIKELARSAG